MKAGAKILFISNMYPSAADPHYGVFIRHIEQNLAARFSVTSVLLRRTPGRARRLAAYLGWYLRMLALGIFGRYDCLYVHFVWISALPVRIILFFHPHTLLVENAHGGDLLPQQPGQGFIPRWARFALRRTDYLVVPSRYYADVAKAHFAFPPERIYISPSGGIDTAIFRVRDKAACRQALQLPADTLLFGCAGRIAPNKGWDIFLAALERLHTEMPALEFRGVLLGRGSEDAQLQSRIQASPIADWLLWRGAVDQPTLAQYYSAWDVFCLPTNIPTETLGLVGLEAMQCGALCAIADLPGPRSYANESNCLLFAQGDAAQCAEMLGRACTLPQSERAALCRHAQATAALYAADRVQAQLLAFFSQI